MIPCPIDIYTGSLILLDEHKAIAFTSPVLSFNSNLLFHYYYYTFPNSFIYFPFSILQSNTCYLVIPFRQYNVLATPIVGIPVTTPR